ncbi:hypothetical protein BDZ45DRAFT_695160 [Acephala macrosclerotiorum]|nr:hypothetical protein BDZ45DRAFT_695160 [Acephala macrosclerotiorum]
MSFAIDLYDSAEDYEPFIDKQSIQERLPFPGRATVPRFIYWALSGVAILAIALLINSTILFSRWKVLNRRCNQATVVQATWVEGKNDAPPARVAPIFDKPTVYFSTGEDERFMGPRTPEKDALWEEDWPIGRGFVRISSTEEPDSEPAHYQVAVFHQYHCMAVMKVFYTQVCDRCELCDASSGKEYTPMGEIYCRRMGDDLRDI